MPLVRSPHFRLQLRSGLGLALALLCLPVGLLRAQTPPHDNSLPVSWIDQDSEYVTRRWMAENGLPHNTAMRVVQDRKGYLWLATGAGLIRFTGTRFVEAPAPVANEGIKLLGENIRDLCLDRENDLLFIPASGGLMRLHNGVVTEHPASTSLHGESLLELFGESEDGLWFGTSTDSRKYLYHWSDKEGLTRFDEKQGLLVENHGRFTFAVDNLGRTWIACGSYLGWYHAGQLHAFTELKGNDFAVGPSRGGGVWVATGAELVRIEGARIVVVKSGEKARDISIGVRFLYEDRGHQLWIGTRRLGLFYMRHDTVVHALKLNDVITSVIEDRERNIWATTEGSGLYRFNPRLFTLLDSNAGMLENNSLSVCDDPSGSIWCANRSGGLMHYVGGKLIPLLRADAQPIYVTSVIADKKGDIWAGASEGLFRVKRNTRDALELVDANLREVRTLFRDSKDRLWIGTFNNRLLVLENGQLRELTGEMGFTDRRVSGFAEDLDGTVWVSTLDQLLVGFRDLKVIQRFSKSDIPGNGNVQTILCDSLGSLWLGTSQGLIFKEGQRFRLLTEADGLPDQLIYQLQEDNRGRLWVGSRRGLYSMAISELRAVLSGQQAKVSAIRFGLNEGMPSASASDGTQPGCWRSKDGRLWFTTHAGIISAAPDQLIPNRPAPLLYIDDIHADRAALPVSDSIILTADTRQLQLQVDALLYSSPEKARVRYQLVGYDPDWNDTPSNGEISYVRLPPGDYTLRIEATNPEARPGSGRQLSLKVTVLPPWWQKGWVLSSAILLLGSLAIINVRFWSQRRLKRRLRQLEREHTLEQERARIARDLHDQLGGSVTQLVLLTERQKRHANDPELKHSLSVLAWRARRLAGEVESIVWAVSPKNNSWPQLASFIEHYASRFCRDSELEFHSIGVDAVPERSLEPEVQHHVLAIVKETLNNIVKHAQASKVLLTIQWRENSFQLSIKDDGRGFEPADPVHAERNGLSNITTRLTELGATGGIVSKPGEGAELRLLLPLPPLPEPIAST